MSEPFANNNDGQSNDEYRESNDAASDKGSPDPSVLDNVLEETILSDADVISDEQLTALREVAKKYRSLDFTLEPIGVSLAEAILSTRYSTYESSDPQWQTMSRQVAESMFDIGHIRARIEGLWNQLCESTQ